MLTKVVIANSTEHRTKEALGHSSNSIWHAYAGPTLAIDAQAIAFDQPQDTKFVQFSQSIASNRDLSAPKPPSALRPKPVPSKELLEEIRKQNPKMLPICVVRKAREVQAKRDLEQYYEKVASEMPPLSAMENESDTRTTPLPLRATPSSEFKHLLKYNHHQVQVIETLFSDKDITLAESIRPMMALADPKPFRALYPSPVLPPNDSEECPYCNTDLTKVKTSRIALHLLDCHCSARKVCFCFDCATFRPKGKLHNCPESDRANQYGVVNWRGLLIREGRCPFAGCSIGRWRTAQKLRLHIEAHIIGLEDGAVPCPHPRCLTLSSKIELAEHLHANHGIHLITGKEVRSRLHG